MIINKRIKTAFKNIPVGIPFDLNGSFYIKVKNVKSAVNFLYLDLDNYSVHTEYHLKLAPVTLYPNSELTIE